MSLHDQNAKTTFLQIHTLSIIGAVGFLLSQTLKNPITMNEVKHTGVASALMYFISESNANKYKNII